MIDLRQYAKKDHKISKMYAIIGLITILLVILSTIFLKNILEKEFAFVETYMEQSVLQTASNLKGRISNSINEMRVLSAKLPYYTDSYSESDITRFLSNHIGDYDFKRLIFAYRNGNTVRIQKNLGKLENLDWSRDQRFTRAITGESVFATTKREPTVPSGYVNEFGVPVYNRAGNIVGIIGSQVYAKNYLEILGFNNYGQKGFSYIVNTEGDFIVKPSRDTGNYTNFFDMKLQFENSDKAKVRRMLKTKDKGTFLFKKNGVKYIASFAVIEDSSEHCVLTFVPLYALMLHIDKLLMMIAFIVISIGVLLLYLLWYSNRIFREKEETIYEVAFLDEVTGGGNKNKFKLKARELLEKNKGNNYAMISIDVTKFKAINELYGIERANKILKDIYIIIKENLKEGSICVRDYAAAFIVLYKYGKEEFIVKYFIEKIINEIEIYNDRQMKNLMKNSKAMISSKISLQFGVYLIQDKKELIDQMCERAYIAKRNIKGDIMNMYQFYDNSMMAQILQEKSIEAEMQHALNDRQFQMYLQPKFNLHTGKLSGAEALARWIHPQRGIIQPMQFIPLFEKNGFVVELDRCMCLQACEFLAERKKNEEELFPISVNVSRIHLNNDSFIADLISLTQRYNIETKYIELELTESACFNNEKRFLEIIDILKELGFKITMDGFGTGYSSLNMLTGLPIDTLKFDRSFIKEATNDARGQIITKSIIDMANKLNMTTVAEGVELEEQANFLREIGCKIAQGFLYGKPVPKEEFIETFIASRY